MTPSNRLEIESLTEDWCDKDVVILHACFQILKDFVEKENWLEHIDWDHTNESKNAKAEIQSLYDWWLKRIEAENDLDEKQYSEDNIILKRLIDVRKHLWT
jgi:hypothetical protein